MRDPYMLAPILSIAAAILALVLFSTYLSDLMISRDCTKKGEARLSNGTAIVCAVKKI